MASLDALRDRELSSRVGSRSSVSLESPLKALGTRS
jgi:hypothetical protein